MSYIKEYLQEIQDGKAIVSKRVHKQYMKLIHDIDNPGKYIFDEARANRPIDFYKLTRNLTKNIF